MTMDGEREKEFTRMGNWFRNSLISTGVENHTQMVQRNELHYLKGRGGVCIILTRLSYQKEDYLRGLEGFKERMERRFMDKKED